MASTSTCLNFDRTTEAAFAFFRTVFGTEFIGPIDHMGDVPTQPVHPALSGEDAQWWSTSACRSPVATS